jgi:hypothetical protein
MRRATEHQKYNRSKSPARYFKLASAASIQVYLSVHVHALDLSLSLLALLTGQPTTDVVQAALNDLPTIYPLTVTVTATSTLYIITFPPEMGDVPLVTCISTSGNAPVINETVQGVASGTNIAFTLNGMTTDYIDFTINVTRANLMAQFNQLFSIQCPVSINNAQAAQSIVYLQDFETDCTFDETNIRSNAFCGQCSLTGNTLVTGNTRGGNYLCFAYKILNSYVTDINVGVYLNGDTTTEYWPSIPFTPTADGLWHYTCIDVFSILSSQSSTYSSASSLVLNYAALSEYIQQGVYIDEVTVRTALPIGYEPQSLYPIDQTNTSSCVFPFIYNGQSYSACTLDNNDMPICLNSQNQTNQCQSSSIEGVRRLYPEHQLVYNTLQVAYTSVTSTIDVSFRNSDCVTPALIQALPSSVSHHMIHGSMYLSCISRERHCQLLQQHPMPLLERSILSSVDKLIRQFQSILLHPIWPFYFNHRQILDF